MNGYEFVLLLVVILIVGLIGLIITSYKCGLFDEDNKKGSKKNYDKKGCE